MRGVNLQRLISVMIFDQPLRTNYISTQFATQHQQYQQQLPYWPFQATRRKMAAGYWFRQVLPNFGIILTVGLLFTMPLFTDWEEVLPSVFLGGLASFLTLTGFIYLPAFYSHFLPKLETVIAEQETLSSQAEAVKKCKRTQYSIPALTVIFYTFLKIGQVPSLAANDSNAELLNKLFGSDKDKLKQNLCRLYKLSRLSVKERAEMQKGIETARSFFEALDSPPAHGVLDQLDLKLQRP